MRTTINGAEADWNEAIWQLWHTHVDLADPKHSDAGARITDANYFTPRPYVDEYNRGDTKEGFTVTVGRAVHMVVISGGVPWRVSRPPRR
jgi:hypothetical protein